MLYFEAAGGEDFRQESFEGLLAKLASEFGAFEDVLEGADVCAQLHHSVACTLEGAELGVEFREGFVTFLHVLGEVLLAGLEVLGEGFGVPGLTFADGFELALEKIDGGTLTDHLLTSGKVALDKHRDESEHDEYEHD